MNKNLAIAASAGTGKTYNLAVRYIHLILQGAEPESIVALTFSRMAANEIFDRVITLLCQWIDNPDKYIKEREALGLPDINTKELLHNLERIIQALHKLPVGTLDSFFINILQSFSIELGLPAGFSIMDNHEVSLVREKILSRILHDGNLKEQEIRRITDAYRLTTIAKDKKSITEAFTNFIENYHERSITESTEIWGELSKGDYPFSQTDEPESDALLLLDRILEYKNSGDFAKTFFDEIILFLQEVSQFKGGAFSQKKLLTNKIGPALKDLQKGECYVFGKRSKNKYLPLNNNECIALSKLAGYVINKIFQQNLLMSQGVEHIVKEYEKRYAFVRKNGKLTFNDIKNILSTGGGLFSSDPDNLSEKLYIDYRLDSKYNHWLLDEFQDTSRQQWKVIDNLIDEVMQDNSGLKSLFYVGDIKQAIYGWRNGDARLFGELVERYSTSDCVNPLVQMPLTKSYRSAKEIMDLCNLVFSNDTLIKIGIPPQYFKRWQWEKHATNRSDMKGFVEYVEFEKEKRKRCASIETFCKYIAEKINDADAFKKGLSVALLVRSNKKGLDFYNGLKAIGIPAELLATEGEVDSNAEKLLHSLIILADHPGNTFALEHVKMSPLKEFANDKLSHEISLMIHEEGYAETIYYWYNKLKDSCELSPFSHLKLKDLVERSRQFDSLGTINSLEWKKFVSENPLPVKSEGNSVQIMTVHKSKGLQYDMVFLPQLQGNSSLLKPGIDNVLLSDNDNSWAFIPPARDIAVLDCEVEKAINEYEFDSFYESLCVLYVAMTRAKYALYMLGSKPPKETNSWHFETILHKALVTENQNTYEVENGELIYSQGDPLWHNAGISSFDDSAPPIKINKPLVIESSQRGSAIAPSGQEKGPEQYKSLFTEQGSDSLDVGLAVHEIFEDIVDISTTDVNRYINRFSKESLYSEDVKNRAIKLFIDSLKKETVVGALTLQNNEIVWNEKKITTTINGDRITGILDRVSIFKDVSGKIISARIIDYKTDRVESTDDIQRSVEKYKPQIKLYQNMVSQSTGLNEDCIDSYLLFVRTGDLILLS